jgi:hypothetical protein
MIRTIPLTLADVHETEALVAVDDKGRRASDIEGGEPETVVDTIALDHRSPRIDEDWKGEPVGVMIVGDFRLALADDHQDFGPKALIRR